MSEETVVNPPGVQKQLQFMLREQELLNNKRLELLNQLRSVWQASVFESVGKFYAFWLLYSKVHL